MTWVCRAIRRLYLRVERTCGVIRSKAAAHATANQGPAGRLPAPGADGVFHAQHQQWQVLAEETLLSTLLALCQSAQEEASLVVDSAGARAGEEGSPAAETDPDEALRRELAAITQQLDALPFRKTNKRIYALLKSPLGKDLPPDVREHLVERTMRNVFDALNADPQVEDLFLREHELEWILYKREHADWYAVEGSVRDAEN